MKRLSLIMLPLLLMACSHLASPTLNVPSTRCLPPGVTEQMVAAPQVGGKVSVLEGNPLTVTIHELAGHTYGFIWFKGEIVAYDPAPTDRTVPVQIKDPESECTWTPFLAFRREI